MKTPYGDVTLKAVKELRSKDGDVEIRKSIPYIGEINTVENKDNRRLRCYARNNAAFKFVATASWTVNRYSADLFKAACRRKGKPFGNG